MYGGLNSGSSVVLSTYMLNLCGIGIHCDFVITSLLGVILSQKQRCTSLVIIELLVMHTQFSD